MKELFFILSRILFFTPLAVTVGVILYILFQDKLEKLFDKD